jgi:hypothetical protein
VVAYIVPLLVWASNNKNQTFAKYVSDRTLVVNKRVLVVAPILPELAFLTPKKIGITKHIKERLLKNHWLKNEVEFVSNVLRVITPSCRYIIKLKGIKEVLTSWLI